MDTADAMDPAALHAALARFDAACAKVEGALEELGGGPSGDAYKRACTTGVRAFMDVKEASRKSYLEISKIQAVVGERRKVLDDQHLQLQNFQYREFRLSEEVKLCREFTCGQLERIEAAFTRLSDDHREVILLSRIVGMSRAEVALALDKTEDSVRNLLHRALTELARHLDVE